MMPWCCLLDKLRSWLPKIQERDYFKAALAAKAVAALAACEKDFAKYGGEVARANERDFQERTATPAVRRNKRQRK